MNVHDASLSIIRAGQAPSGAYVASPNFSQYGYCWLRDGTWTAYAMDVAGDHASAGRFYRWVGRTLAGQQARLDRLLGKLARGEPPTDEDYLPTRFTLDGDLGADDWWDFQLDGYGAWLWGLDAHLNLTGDDALWDTLHPAVELTVRYLAALWDTPNYDCWEEARDHVHVSTLAAIYGGLRAVETRTKDLVPAGLTARIQSLVLAQGVADGGHLRKHVATDAVDASLLWAAIPYGLVDIEDPLFVRTLDRIEAALHRPGGGVYRYASDTYFGGGEWVLLAAWLGWVDVKLGRMTEARALWDWIVAQAGPDGALPEQVNTHMLDANRYAEWEKRWGPVACPLLWSHAMVLILEAALEKRI
jgi:GH15 family glucan-1,4-alpha-glucosidase